MQSTNNNRKVHDNIKNKIKQVKKEAMSDSQRMAKKVKLLNSVIDNEINKTK